MKMGLIPWKLQKSYELTMNGDFWHTNINTNKGGNACEKHLLRFVQTEKPTENDLKLMNLAALAPEMLDALQTIKVALDREFERNGNNATLSPAYGLVFNIIRKAI